MAARRRGPVRLAAAMLVCLCAVLAACVGCDSRSRGANRARAASQPFRIVARDHRFESPARLAAGLRHIVFENRGTHIHEAMLVKLPDGMTAADYVAIVNSGNLFPDGGLDYSGAGLTAPGESLDLWLRVDPGNYIVICWNGYHPGNDPPHGLTVVADGSADDVPPKEDAVLRLVDYRFEFDRPIEKGPRTLRIETPGPSMHEVDIFRLREGATVADLESWYKLEDSGKVQDQPGPAEAVGGLGDNHDIRRVGWLRRTFAPGRYVFMCHLPMPSAGKDAPKLSHADVGMVKELVVAP